MQSKQIVVFLNFLILAAVGQAREAEPSAIKPIHASNRQEIREHVGRYVTIRGHVRSTGKSRSGIQFLNFADSELSVVCFASDVRRFGPKSPVELYRDQEIEITGRLDLYRGKPQIKLRSPDQIRLSSRGPRAPPKGQLRKTDLKPIELKQIDRETWTSPAGLRYSGRDPQGRTRVEHVLRHARDIPNRDGPHGVFDGGEELVFAWIDEAWRLAKEQGIRPTREGQRTTYTIPMGRRAGYLGGRLGARRGKPPLKRVFVVFETGTREVITAFPK